MITTHTLNSLVFDPADRRLKTEELYDFKGKTRQLLYSYIYKGDRALNQKVSEFLKKIDKDASIDAAWEALILLEKLPELEMNSREGYEEVQAFLASGMSKEDYLAENPDLATQWDELMGTMKNYVEENKTDISSLEDIKTLMQKAKIHDAMENDENYKSEEELQAANPHAYAHMKAMEKDELLELIYGTSFYHMKIDDDILTEEDTQFIENIEFVEDYANLAFLQGDLEVNNEMTGLNENNINFTEIAAKLEHLHEEDLIYTVPTRSLDEVENYMQSKYFYEKITSLDQWSDSFFQNLLYTLFKNFHDYEGGNTMNELIAFANEDDKDAL